MNILIISVCCLQALPQGKTHLSVYLTPSTSGLNAGTIHLARLSVVLQYGLYAEHRTRIMMILILYVAVAVFALIIS